jgi:hypothetical protein
MSSVDRASFLRAAGTIFQDVPAVLVSLAFAVLMTAIAAANGREPDFQEGARLFFAVAGLLFHLASRKEAVAARTALLRLPQVDTADLEAIDNMVRREHVRLVVKTVFVIVTLAAMAVPPQDTQTFEIARLIGGYSLLVILILLDLDAVLDRTSRRRQVQLIRENMQVRARLRAERLEAQRPAYVARNVELSKTGRGYVHDINNDLAVVVGLVDTLTATGEIPEDERIDLAEASAKLDSATECLRKLQALVRSIGDVEA